VDDSSLAVLPIPVVAFFVPHWNLHDIKADDYPETMRRARQVDQPPCGDQSYRLHTGGVDPHHQPRHLAVVSGQRVVGSRRQDFLKSDLRMGDEVRRFDRYESLRLLIRVADQRELVTFSS
jgi:hypothetical protein